MTEPTSKTPEPPEAQRTPEAAAAQPAQPVEPLVPRRSIAQNPLDIPVTIWRDDRGNDSTAIDIVVSRDRLVSDRDGILQEIGALLDIAMQERAHGLKKTKKADNT